MRCRARTEPTPPAARRRGLGSAARGRDRPSRKRAHHTAPPNGHSGSDGVVGEASRQDHAPADLGELGEQRARRSSSSGELSTVSRSPNTARSAALRSLSAATRVLPVRSVCWASVAASRSSTALTGSRPGLQRHLSGQRSTALKPSVENGLGRLDPQVQAIQPSGEATEIEPKEEDSGRTRGRAPTPSRSSTAPSVRTDATGCGHPRHFGARVLQPTREHALGPDGRPPAPSHRDLRRSS